MDAGFDAATTSSAAQAVAQGLWRCMLDELDYGLILVTLAGDVQFANKAARRQCRAARSIRISGGCLEAEGADDARALRRCLEAAGRQQRSMLQIDGDPAIRSMAFIPLQDQRGERGAHALVVLGRLRACEPISLALFARRHQVTQAEAAVLQSLCDGLRPQEIAQRSHVGVSTVRTQISSLRVKTGAPSIGELVRTAAMLPPIVQMLN
jgi:DNA-binding CsgD family transcriptional regulator